MGFFDKLFGGGDKEPTPPAEEVKKDVQPKAGEVVKKETVAEQGPDDVEDHDNDDGTEEGGFGESEESDEEPKMPTS